ncbi:MAG: ATP-binding protein [Candidatus Aminicenantes bacterium]|nr:ATP-binding protein [Candidatus Aminicenantes bacterium]
MKSLLNWKLRSKIILHILVIGTITAVFISYFYTKSQRDIIKSSSRQTVSLIGEVIEQSILETMKEGRSDKVQAILENISESRNVKTLRILSPDGAILTSSTSQETGNQIGENELKRLGSFLSDVNSNRPLPFVSHDFIQEYRLIRNDKECITCHDAGKDILGVLEMNFDYSSVFSIWEKNRTLGIIVSLAALMVLTLIILRLFEKIINRPIFNLKNRMKKIQEGDFASKVPITKDDEIGDLAKSFNIMITKLEEANNRIEEMHEKQMEKAEHLASLGEIAAGLAHDIKNPIAGMKGALEIIHQKTDDSDSNKEVFKEVLIQIDKIDQIIGDLLRYAKPKELFIREVPFEECVDHAVKLAQMQVKNKNIQFHVNSTDKNIQASLDADKIQEVLLNLILNGVAAIPEKGTITIHSTKQNNKDLRITVSDNGTGIKKEQLSQIFQPFFTTKSHGTGLGLSICQKAIAAHSGTLEVESEEGKGTTFTILLPVVESKENS